MEEARNEYQKGYYTAKSKYLKELNQVKYEHEHQIHDVNSVFPFNLMQDLMEDSEFNLDYSARNIKNVMQKKLTDREYTVLELRYGRRMTLEEVGKEFGVTRERIRQVEAKALRKLKNPSTMKSMSVVSYDEHQALKAENVKLNVKVERLEKALGDNSVEAEKNSVLDMPIEDLELSVRSCNCLKRYGLTTAGKVVEFVARHNSLAKIRNLGRKSAKEISDKFMGIGIDLNLENDVSGFSEVFNEQ